MVSLPNSAAATAGAAELKNELAICFVILPIAEIFEEPARIVGTARDLCARTGRLQVFIDTLTQQSHLFLREDLADTNRAIAVKVFHQLRRDGPRQTGGYGLQHT